MTDKRKRTETLGDLMQAPHKDATQPRRPRRRRTSAWCVAMLGLVFLLSVVIAAGAAIIWYEPEVFGMGLTGDLTLTVLSVQRIETALQETAVALHVTAQHNDAGALANASTRAALDAWQQQLDRDATQSAFNAFTTQTAVAVSNVQQATRAALNFQATQGALDYQGTQAAVNREATSSALGVTAAAQSGNVIPTYTPAATPVALFSDDFSGGLSGGLWQYAVDDWDTGSAGNLVARRSGAWLLTRTATFNDYTVEMRISPAVGAALAIDYYLLLSVPENGDGLALRLTHDGEKVTFASLFWVTRAALRDAQGIFDDNLEAVAFRQVALPPGDTLSSDALRVRVEVRDGVVRVAVNDTPVLEATPGDRLTSGAVGAQMPVGARITFIALYP